MQSLAPKTTFVQQRHDWDCAIASIAMMMGVTYEAVVETLPSGREQVGLDDREICRVISALGGRPFPMMYAYGGVSGVASVPSLNHPGRLHMIYIDDQHRIYDPNRDVCGRHYYTGTFRPAICQMFVDLRDEHTRETADCEIAMQLHFYQVETGMGVYRNGIRRNKKDERN